MSGTPEQYTEFNKLAGQHRVWHWFQEISNIPRGSGHEQAICEYLINFAKVENLECRQDESGNVFINKPAQKGGSDAVVALQGHVDMVWQKTDNSDFDFLTQPIRPYVDGEWVTAGETTLGADNGVAVAYIMAVLEDQHIAHPNIEAILTIGEETGLIGANAMDASLLKSTMMINLDGGPFGGIIVGCAGGVDSVISFDYTTQIAPDDTHSYTITVEGLKGGHSGGNINQGRQNANKLMVRILRELSLNMEIYIQSIHSDYPRNAIPRLCKSTIFVKKEDEMELGQMFLKLVEILNHEIKPAEPNLHIGIEQAYEMNNSVILPDEQNKILRTLNAVPNGVYKHSPINSSLVDTSTNMATIQMANGQCTVGTLQRGVNTPSMFDLADKIADTFEIAQLNNLKIEQFGKYDGWQPDYNSPLVAKAVESYQKLFNIKPTVETCHGGLECAIIDSAGVMEKIAVGPEMEDLHSPGERVKTKTVTDFELVLHDLLAKI